jgi:hypothetical protein
LYFLELYAVTRAQHYAIGWPGNGATAACRDDPLTLGARDTAIAFTDHQHLVVIGIQNDPEHFRFFEACARKIPINQLHLCTFGIATHSDPTPTIYSNADPASPTPGVSVLFIDDNRENRERLLLTLIARAPKNARLPTVQQFFSHNPAYTMFRLGCADDHPAETEANELLYDLAQLGLARIANGTAIDANAN